MFEQIILDNSKLPIAGLYSKALKASKNPLTGIEKTSNKYVEFVIRDCAKIARMYLPIMIYGSYDNPIQSLKSKFSKKDIIDIVGRAEKNIEVRQLLKLVLASVQKYQIDGQLKTNDLVTVHETKENVEVDDIYGDYLELPDTFEEQEENVDVIDLTNLSSKEIANYLIKVFEAK